MKLRKAYIYFLSFLCLCVMFSACYYLSYMRALREFNKKAVERMEEYASIDKQVEPTPNIQKEDNTLVSVDTLPIVETVLPSTKVIMEIYDDKTDKLQTEELSAPGYLVGLSRQEVIQYLEDYMNDLTLSEYNKGLLSYELLSFSGQQIVLRKNYNEDMMTSRYYVVVKNGFVVVYYGDLKNVFRYTEIEAKTLPEEDRIELSRGIYVNSLKELYSLLESYTS